MLIASRQKTTFAIVLVLHTAGPAVGYLNVKECDVQCIKYFQGSCVVFTNTIYQISRWKSIAVY